MMIAFIILALCLLSCINAFQLTSSRAGVRAEPRSFVEMKGKGNRVPIDQRGEFMKQQRMMEMREKMKQTKAEGVPVFKVFVRPIMGGLWVPCGDLAGDSRATALVNAWMSGFMADMYKSQLDQGIAKSIFSQESTFLQGLIDNYKPFKKMKPSDLEFGYKIDFPGLEEKMGEQKTMLITRDMQKGWLDNVKESLGGIFGGNNEEEKKA